jgi:hypothetical protein
MNTIKNDIEQLVKAVMAKGYSENFAVGWALATAWQLLEENQVDEMFASLKNLD